MSDNICVNLWKPISSIPYEVFDVNSIVFKGNTLSISLCDDGYDYYFVFDELITNYGSYKYTTAMHNLELNDKLKEWYEQCGIIGKTYPLLILHSSDYLESTKKQTYYAFTDDYKELKHYVFITYDAMIEVVSCKEPICKKERKKE